MSVYVVMTKPGYERIAARHMARRGVTLYMPMSRHYRRAGGRKVNFDRPILPGYVFVWSDEVVAGQPALVRDWEVVRKAEGVTDVLGLVDDRWLAAILILQCFGSFDATLKRRVELRIGRLVRVVGTIWAGQVGKVVAVSETMVKVCVEGRMVHGPINVDRGAIDLLPEPQVA